VLPLPPVFMSYVLSFICVGIYWNKLQYGYYPFKQALMMVPSSSAWDLPAIV
jgi:uncharacterized membrane protein